MQSVLGLISSLVDIYVFLVIANVVISWLVAFKVINVYHPVVNSIVRGIHSVTEPALARIRRILPSMGGMDFSPIVLILLLVFSRNLLFEYLY